MFSKLYIVEIKGSNFAGKCTVVSKCLDVFNSRHLWICLHTDNSLQNIYTASKTALKY